MIQTCVPVILFVNKSHIEILLLIGMMDSLSSEEVFQYSHTTSSDFTLKQCINVMIKEWAKIFNK